MTLSAEDYDDAIQESDEDLQEFLNDESYIHYVAMATRPGVCECITRLEWLHYRPGTSRNDLFLLRIFEWHSLHWVGVSIPIEEKGFMEKIANESGLKVSDGIPTMISDGEVSVFPMCNERVFSLTNTSGHPVYKNDPDVNRALLEGDIESSKRIRKSFS